MSQIFDALQRSETERGAKNVAADLRATEMLQRAERDAFASRASTTLPDAWTTPLATESSVAVAETGGESFPPIAAALRTTMRRSSPR